MKVALEKKINLYKRCLKKEGLSDLDRISLENKREWASCQLLILVMGKETSKKIIDLTDWRKLSNWNKVMFTVLDW
jgi:hypothetical protein